MRILVAEHDERDASILIRYLEAQCFVVDRAKDGVDGSFLARTNDYDAVLINADLMRKNGQSVCADMRRCGKSAPVLMFSADIEATRKAVLLDAGADDCVAKPFDVSEVMARVRALLRRPKMLCDETIRVDDLVIKTSGRRVWRGEREVRLTRKEFNLLEHLARNRGRVVSRASIMEHVWDMHADVFSNTIEAHILSIRRKVDILGACKLIHTVSGCGYVLDVRT
jgi:DNA-binding response OmpR family regulator